MKTNKTIRKVGLMLMMACGLLSCEKSELQGYTGGNTVGFWEHYMNHSLYGLGSDELPVDTVTLDIAATGDVVDYDRVVEGTFIPDEPGTPEDELKNTAVEGKDYKLLGGVIPANEIYGKFKLLIINNDYLDDKTLKLNLTIKENKDFMPGLKQNKNIVLSFSRKIMRPKTWNAMRFFFCATYSTQVYKVFMEATGLKEFYYYEGIVTQEEGYVMGRNFGNIVRKYEEEHGTPMLHDDGPAAGQPIIPIH